MIKAQNRISLTINGQSMCITLADTEAARTLESLVADSPVTVRMSDYGGFEKVGELPWALPTDNRQISTVAGDVMLYQGNNIVIFYGPNSWSYTPLGKIEGATADEIRDFLAGSTVEAILSTEAQSGISDVPTDRIETSVYNLHGAKIDMSGRTLSDLPGGLYIINGEKRLIK